MFWNKSNQSSEDLYDENFKRLKETPEDGQTQPAPMLKNG